MIILVTYDKYTFQGYDKCTFQGYKYCFEE